MTRSEDITEMVFECCGRSPQIITDSNGTTILLAHAEDCPATNANEFQGRPQMLSFSPLDYRPP